MEENMQLSVPNPNFPAGKREIWLLLAMAVCGVGMANVVFYGGLNLGFAVMAIAVSSLSFAYLRRSGCKGGGYANALFVLNLIIGASFVRSDDAFVKFVMVCFLLLGGNLSMVLTAGQNRRDPGGLTSLLDAPMALFTFGLGQLGRAFGGLNDTRKNAGGAVKKNMAVLTGLAVAVPVLAILIPLLMRADAAFEGLIGLLPEWDFSEAIVSLIFGIPASCVLYTRNAALKHRPKAEQDPWTPRKFSALTVNTVLICVGLVYCVYLVSQLAYFVGGFSGILPEEFTMAEYARRGFFEMTWLAVINLGIIVASAALTEPKDSKVPLFTRSLCLFVGIVTLFFAATASAKMFLYIGSYGLTRLRLLVQVIIVFIALTVIFVAVWLFKPKFAYMKAVLLAGLIIGASVAWADVDTVVAAYNVSAYQSGRLESIDMSHLCDLGDGAVPYLQALVSDTERTVAEMAKQELSSRAGSRDGGLRSWNMAAGTADSILKEYKAREDALQESANCFPLCILTAYDDVSMTARDLTAFKREFSTEPLKLYVKEDGLYDGDGNYVVEPYVSYDAMFHLEDSSTASIEVTDHYVLFRTDEDQNHIMLWTERVDAATEILTEQFPDMVLTPVAGPWYVITAEGRP